MSNFLERYPFELRIISQIERLINETFPGEKNLIDESQKIIFVLSSKAVKTFSAGKILCSNGYGLDAIVLVRVLIELHLTMLYITEQESIARAKMYCAYEVVVRWKLMQEALNGKFGKITKQDRLDIKKGALTLKNDYEEALKKYPHFTGEGLFAWIPNQDNLNESMSIESLFRYYKCKHYKGLYYIACQFIHSNPTSINGYVYELENEIKVQFDASDTKVKQASHYLIYVILNILETTNNFLNLVCKQSLENIKREVNSSVEKEGKK